MPKKVLLDNSTPEEVFENTKHYCPLLWCHLHVNTLGDVQPCCMAPFGSSLGNINDESFDEIWNGEPMKKLRVELLEDRAISTCVGCYEKEQSGNWSLRKASIIKHHNNVKEHLKTTTYDGESKDSKPTYWDIRFSNICNMRCRMCGHFSSSKWFNDAKRLSEEFDNHMYLGHAQNQAIIKGVEDSAGLLDRLDEYLPYVQELYFAGGEPMIMEEHYRILKRLDELGLYDTFIRYNTNFLQLYYKDKDILSLWKKFKNVSCSASLDSYGKRAELIRKDTVWGDIENNMQRVLTEAPHVKINIAPTVQILNILSVTDLHKDWCERGWLGPNDMFFNILHTPDFYNLKALPPVLKKEATAKLLAHLEWLQEKYSESLYSVRNTIMNTIAYMNSEQKPEIWLYELVKQTKQLDIVRNENTPEVFPELKYIWENYNAG
jgi:MoaA/NifB/PqqE/SkfB family radical SAM enzyme